MRLNKKRVTFCYFGIYRPTWARDTVLIEGLKRRGAELVYATDSTPGLKKYFRLIAGVRSLRQFYDYLLVGYSSTIVVPLARLLTRQPVIFNAGNSMYEGSVLDRGHRSWLKKERYTWLMDFLAFHCAHVVIVETAAQRDFVARSWWVPKRKLLVLPTGADDTVFHPDLSVVKRPGTWVVFRGWFIPGTGVEYVLDAARELASQGIHFLLIGRGFLLQTVKQKIHDEKIPNVELITQFLEEKDLRQMMLSCHIMLGQFSGHPRLERTIQNKTYEALALGMPYITQRSQSNEEILTDGIHCLFTKPADSKDLAKKILILTHDAALRQRLAREARRLFENRFTPEAIADRLLQFLAERR